MNQKQIEQIDALFQLWQDQMGAGGQLVVEYRGERLERCYGYQNIETGTPMTQESVFHIASMSKQITAMCIYMLYEQGKLDLDDDIKRYLPDLVKVPQTITIRNMLHHTSGWPGHYDFLFLAGGKTSDTGMPEEIVELNSRVRELNFEPGDEFMYSNPNYVLLAIVVERLSGQSFRAFCDEHIFRPLGMTHTVIRDDPEMLIPNRVNSYYDDGYVYRNAILNLCMYGSTGVLSTARDMNRFLHQYTEPTLISTKTMQEHMLTIPPLKQGGKTIYGGGVRLETLCGHRCIHHGGITAGFRTFGICFPEDELYITLFSNTDNLAIELVGRDVARVVMELPPRKKPDLSTFAADLAQPEDAVGCYYCAGIEDSFEICVRDGMLYSNGVRLLPVGGSCFRQGRMPLIFVFGEQPLLLRNDVTMKLSRLPEGLSKEQADQYVGTYECRQFESRWRISREEDQLWLFHIRRGRMKLRWMGGDRFCGAKAIWTFVRDEQGRVVGLERHTNLLRRARLFRCQPEMNQ